MVAFATNKLLILVDREGGMDDHPNVRPCCADCGEPPNPEAAALDAQPTVMGENMKYVDGLGSGRQNLHWSSHRSLRCALATHSLTRKTRVAP